MTFAHRSLRVTDSSNFTDDCVIQQAKIAKLEQPLAYNLKMLRRWLSHPAYGDSFLLELESQTWEKMYDKDLITIPKPDVKLQNDALSRFVMGPLVELYHVFVGRLYKVKKEAFSQALASIWRCLAGLLDWM